MASPTEQSTGDPTDEPTDEPTEEPVDLDPGEEYWSFETGGLVFSGPSIVDGTVYFGSEDMHMYAVDAETGAEQWRFKVGETPGVIGGGPKGKGIYSSPRVANGSVYFGANDHHVYSVDADTGEQEWRVKTESLVYGSPTVNDGVVYASGRDANMYTIDAETGDVLWTEYIGISGVSPLVVDGRVYTGSYDTDAAASCLDAATGDVIWRQEAIETCSSPQYVDGLILIGTLNENVYALDADTGDIVWETPLTGSQNHALPTIKDGTAYIGQYSGSLVALDVATGDIEWTMDEPSSSGNQSPTVVGDKVVFVDQDARVYVVDRATGDIEFKDYFHSNASVLPYVSSSIVVDGVLFVGTVNDHTLHAMEIPVDGSSDGSRVHQSGTLNQHHGFLDREPQELDMQATGSLAAEGVEDVTAYRTESGDGPYEGWMDAVPHYDDATVDMRGRDEVTVLVGAGPNGFGFDPAAILIDPHTTVTWEWTGRGGSHNILTGSGAIHEDFTSEEGFTVREYIGADSGGVMKYYCEPHKESGMKGVVAVRETDDDLVDPENA